jgi:hypothetical protein
MLVRKVGRLSADCSMFNPRILNSSTNIWRESVTNCNKRLTRLKLKVRKVYSRSKYSQNYQVQLMRLSKELLLAKGRLRKNFYFRSYTTKVYFGQISISMLKDAEEREKTFWRSRTMKASSSQEPQKRPSSEIPTMYLYSAVRAILMKCNQRTQVCHSLLVRT